MNDNTNTQVIHHAINKKDNWNHHIQGAVSKFLKTAVVIDNEPWVRQEKNINESPASSIDLALGAEPSKLVPPEINSQSGLHHLDVRAVSDVFTENGVACAFFLPDDNNNNKEVKKKRALSAAKVSDLVVIDWYLESKSSSLTLQILEEIAKSDTEENGRLRLICIYTGETLNSNIFVDVKKYLSNGGITVTDVEEEEFCAENATTIVVLKNKDETKAEELPIELIKLFSRFANGLIPSFALAAVGAIRRNTHHMLTRFGSIIDPAYISNRLITNPPGDVAELMRELMVAECDNALGLESVADDYLEKRAITLWLDVFSEQISPQKYKSKENDEEIEIEINRDFIDNLLEQGVNDSDFKSTTGETIRFPENKRSKVSVTLSGTAMKSKLAQNEFSRLVAFRRESYGSTTRLMNPSWLPSLTTGTILKYNDNGEDKYLMCFTPACDTLRIQKPRPFVFIEGIATNKKYNLVVTTSNQQSIGIYFEKKHPVVKTFYFLPDKESERVRAAKIGDGTNISYFFSSCSGTDVKLEWLGEIRYNRAASEMANIANIWMRIGIIDSEYLRLASRGHINFQ